MALYSPLSENMSEFFLIAFLALFSGLFPCAEPSPVSDGEKGKETPGRRECAVRGNLAPRAVGSAARCWCGRQMLCNCSAFLKRQHS